MLYSFIRFRTHLVRREACQAFEGGSIPLGTANHIDSYWTSSSGRSRSSYKALGSCQGFDSP